VQSNAPAPTGAVLQRIPILSGDGLQDRGDLGVASCWAADVVQLPCMVRSMVLGAAHEPIPATVPVGSVRWEKLQKDNTVAVKRNIKQMRQCTSARRCL
jgi:hypothetical protein